MEEIKDIELDEIQRELNETYGYNNALTEGFNVNIFRDGIIKEYTPEQLIEFFSNPQKYHKELEKVAQYYYTTNGDIFQQFDLAKILPSLNYKIETLEQTSNYETHIKKINTTMKKINHKELTRDLISQLVTSGTVVGLWIGDKKNPYLYIFDDLEFIFPAHRKNGKWTVWLDLAWFDIMGDIDRETQFDNLYPYVLRKDYEIYKEDPEKVKYVEFPIERSVVLRTHTLKRNQRFGLSWSTQGLFDILHKKKLKDLEKAVANKIIKSVAVLTIGSKEYPNLEINKKLKRKVYAGVKSALQKNQQEGVTCIAVPEFTDLNFPENKSDALDPKKFVSIDSDIANSTGIGRTLTSGNGGNYAGGKINLEIFYKRIANILEDIENEVYQKLLSIILPKTISINYGVVYDKKPPITQKEQIEILLKLHSEGFGVKPIIDMLDGVDFVDYVNQSIYEIEQMKLKDIIQPYQTAYTISGNGKSQQENPDNENTIKTKNSNANKTPEN